MVTVVLDKKDLDNEELDTVWLELILEARKLGISVDEIRELLKHSS
ncbi:DNA-binding anti-repressor SinI [Neobacillus sp. BF23-41]